MRELVDVLVRLHSVVPADVGLSDFGKPQGYLERQVRRFADQLEQIRYRETPSSTSLPGASRTPSRPIAIPGSSTATTGWTTPSLT